MTFTIRPVENTDEDLTRLTAFAADLAAHDGHEIHFDARKLAQAMFAEGTSIRGAFGCRNEEPIGFIVWYECFSIYYGERGLYIPGFYIVSDFRHLGYGVRLFQYVKSIAKDHNCKFLNGIVEANNEKANRLYRKLGAEISTGWDYCRLPVD
jgi:ribosomal protein S18 acetylase RimI-like enzyme